MKIIRTNNFADWLKSLKDLEAKARLNKYFDRVARNGLSGDIQPVGEGVSEIRFHFGPGYRVYFIQRGKEVIILLGGGDKSSQKIDIKDAKSLASELNE